MYFFAVAPCPYPSEIDLICFYLSSANWYKEAKGSAPGESIKIKGVTEDES